jgi:hypothetical protein
MVNKETTKSTIMITKNLILLTFAMFMAFASSEVKANVNNINNITFQHQLHPRHGKVAKRKAKHVKHQLIKREFKKRALRSRRRGITIVI